MTIWKTTALSTLTFVGKVKSLLFTLSMFVIDFLPSSKRPLISWLPLPSALSVVILEPKKICHFPLLPFCLPWSDGAGCSDLSCFHVEFQASFFTPLSPSSRGSSFSSLSVNHLHIWGCRYPHPQSWFQLVIPSTRQTRYLLISKRYLKAWKSLHSTSTFSYSSLTRKTITVKICSDRLGAINLPMHHRFGPDCK